jgi:hypothetical protein
MEPAASPGQGILDSFHIGSSIDHTEILERESIRRRHMIGQFSMTDGSYIDRIIARLGRKERESTARIEHFTAV